MAVVVFPTPPFILTTARACIDGDIVLKDGKYHLFFKGESGKPGIKLAISDNLTEGYKLIDEAVQQTKDPVEGAGVFKLNDGSGYILMYDVYTKGKYQFTKSADLKKFEVVDHSVSMDFHPRHGTVLPITTAEAESLIREWMPEREIRSAIRRQRTSCRILRLWGYCGYSVMVGESPDCGIRMDMEAAEEFRM